MSLGTPVPPAGRPIESSNSPDGELHARHRLVSQARLHATLQALSAVHYSPLCEYEGDDRTGTYVYNNGCGDHFAMAWSCEGFVALVFDHDMNDEAEAPEEQWDPERFFRSVPASLAPLVSRVITLGNRQATGSLWITDGPDARWDAQRNPGAPVRATAWAPVLGAITALVIGATALMSTLAFSGQRYFEWQVEESRALSQ